MVKATNCTERLTFEQIMEKYPDQWVGLDEIEPQDISTVKSAVVKEVGDKNDLLRRQFFDDALQLVIYTTPDNRLDYFTQW